MKDLSLISCTDGQANFLKFFDLSLAPELLYYSYVSIIFIALFLGVYVLFANKFSTISKVLFLLTLFFSLFIFSELSQWVIIPAGFMQFAYSLSLLLQLLILFSTIYFVYLYVTGRDLSFLQKVIMVAVGSPIAVLLPTKLNIIGVELDSCSGIPGILWNYFYALELLTAISFMWGSVVVFKKYRVHRSEKLLSSLYLLIGASVFLAIFFASYFFADTTGIYEINLVGPLGMLIFIGVLSYLIVKFKAFNIELLGAQALVVALVLLVGSQYFFVDSATATSLTSVTLALALGFGYFLIRSVQKEVRLRKQIEVLVIDLDKANQRLKVLDKMKSEFVSIASHQLRSPLTSIRGYASMLAEGSFGKLPSKVQDVAEKIAESAKYMALSIEDFLNVSRIEAGNMKYELSDFNLKEQTSKVVDEMLPSALKKGLVMMFRSDCTGTCSVHADIGKTRQILLNLIDNSMKYTPKGTITVIAHDDVKKKKMYVSIHDTGVGMSKETIDELFDKFVRAKNANNVNVSGTGLGLFIAKKMANEMGATIWAESEGEGKGSTFHVEFPLLPK